MHLTMTLPRKGSLTPAYHQRKPCDYGTYQVGRSMWCRTVRTINLLDLGIAVVAMIPMYDVCLSVSENDVCSQVGATENLCVTRVLLLQLLAILLFSFVIQDSVLMFHIISIDSPINTLQHLFGILGLIFVEVVPCMSADSRGGIIKYLQGVSGMMTKAIAINPMKTNCEYIGDR